MIELLNNSKLFAGIMMIFLNIASKFVTIDLSKTQKEFLANSILRQVLIFAVAFVGTRDLLISILLTAAFTVMVDGLLSAASTETNPAKRADLFSKAQRQVNADAPWIFLWVPEDIYGVSKRLKGWQPSADSRVNLHRAYIQ